MLWIIPVVLRLLLNRRLMLDRQHLLACAEQLQETEELTKRHARVLRRAEAQKTV